MTNPVILYCCKGITYICYAIWSIRSLQKFGYGPVEVIVSNEEERQFFNMHCPDITCGVVNAGPNDYPAFSYKPFVLTKYLKGPGIAHKGRDIVICDADILWNHDPALLFSRLQGQNWVHKITAVNPLDYEIPAEQVRESNIGLRTIQNYSKRSPVSVYPNFIVNAGLFMLPENIFPEMLENWMDKILSLPPDEMLMSEALMSLTYAEMGLVPVSDRENIKHIGIEKADTDKQILGFAAAPPVHEGEYTGYETARHYYGSQRDLFHSNAETMGLDHDDLVRIVKKQLLLIKIRNIPGLPAKLLGKFKRVRQES